jgi:hypothetical protein
MNRGIQHYSKDVCDKMTEEQKKKLRNDHAKAKAAKANIWAKVDKDVQNVSAVYTVIHQSSHGPELAVKQGMFELDLDGLEDVTMEDPNLVTLAIAPIPFVVPPLPLCNSSKMGYHRSCNHDVDLLIHSKAEALYKDSIHTWTDDMHAYSRTIENFKSMGRVLPIPEYPAHPPPYET